MSDARGARWLILVTPILAVACQTRASRPTSTVTLTAANIPNAAEAQVERMPHCPSVVPGAITIATEVPDGIELRITAEGEATSEIRRRAARLASASDDTRGKHRATGALNAQFGRCPVVMRDTRLEVREVPGGVAVVLRPTSELRLGWLRREVESRTAQLATPRQFGEGLMKWCPSAVPGSVTAVVDKPYGVDVKITAPTPEGAREIRERAKHAVGEAASQGERCPTSVAEAKLGVTEVPGGVVVALKAKRPDDRALLRHSVHERACSFASPTLE